MAKAAETTATLAVAGVAGYEGGLRGETQADTLELAAAFCRRLRGFADAVAAAGVGRDKLIVSAGGSASFDVVARELTAPGATPVTVILRSGCYLTHDHGIYARVTPAARGAAGAPELRPALELWALVVSRPEPGLALLGPAGATWPSTRASRSRCGCCGATAADQAGPAPTAGR